MKQYAITSNPQACEAIRICVRTTSTTALTVKIERFSYAQIVSRYRCGPVYEKFGRRRRRVGTLSTAATPMPAATTARWCPGARAKARAYYRSGLRTRSSARVSIWIRFAISDANPTVVDRPRDPRAGHQRDADQFPDDADIVGMSHEPIGPRDDERRLRHDDDSKRPRLAEATGSPTTSALWPTQIRTAPIVTAGRGAPPRSAPSAIIARKAPG